MPTHSYINSQKGYAALIGLLLAIAIIALLTYGGYFFSKKGERESQIEKYHEVKVDAGAQLDKVNDVTKEMQKEIDK